VSLSQHLTHSYRQDEISKRWFLVDADGQTLGRIASRVAHVLRGKHKPQFTPNVDSGDFVVVVNCDKVKLIGRRPALKEYFSYTGYPGGDTYRSFADLMKKHPEKVFTHAVKGMIPHNRLGRRMITKLKVYAGPNHPHSAQKPEPLQV
jgi:large subunit ribosomal protein L13